MSEQDSEENDQAGPEVASLTTKAPEKLRARTVTPESQDLPGVDSKGKIECYFLTLIFFFTVLPPAFFEATLKVVFKL
jgi:hypothetical protein